MSDIQMVFPFMLERYSISSDSWVPLTQEYVDSLEQVKAAYTQIMLAVQKAEVDGFQMVPVATLDAIHSDLKQKLNVST